jgi:hypothetical protein
MRHRRPPREAEKTSVLKVNLLSMSVAGAILASEFSSLHLRLKR